MWPVKIIFFTKNVAYDIPNLHAKKLRMGIFYKYFFIFFNFRFAIKISTSDTLSGAHIAGRPLTCQIQMLERHPIILAKLALKK